MAMGGGGYGVIKLTWELGELRVVAGAEGRGVTATNYYSPGDPNERLIRSEVSMVKYLSNIFATVVQILVFFFLFQ